MGTGIATYYDRLGRWNRVARAFGFGGGSGSLTVHRSLADPRADGRPTFTRLHDVIIGHMGIVTSPRVLDAGCGLGGTMLALADALGADCTGLTLSPSQADVANHAARRGGCSERVRALVQSYDTPPAGPFDLVVAIESLAHSQNPATSVTRLARVLAPGGSVAVVDDMPEEGAYGSADLATFKNGWQCPVLWSRTQYLEAFNGEGLDICADVDLTVDARPRTRPVLALLIVLNRAVHLLPFAPLRQLMDSHLGGLALERLTRAGLVRYRLLIARRPELRVS